LEKPALSGDLQFIRRNSLVVNFIIALLNTLMVIGSLFLICIVLIQRGKGGGLAGAFGGVGGSSAFGTKAGDVFTRITIVVAIAWILSAMLLVVLTNRNRSSAYDVDTVASETRELDGSSTKPKSKTPGPDLGPEQPLPQIPMLPPDSTSSPPPVDIPAIPELPPMTPPSTKPSPSAPASTTPPASKPASPTPTAPKSSG
jgi:preprotein translocase subunit SecG